MPPYYQDNHTKVFNKDCRSMDELQDESVQCVVTSPPYWGLRKYAGEQELIWGDNHGEHSIVGNEKNPDIHTGKKTAAGFCSLCGAWKGAYGLEPTPELYVQHTVEILREIRRVLRKDGVVFWNIGDSYAGSGMGAANYPGDYPKQNSNIGTLAVKGRKAYKDNILKPKDLCLIPFRVAIAAQEDGWWVRSVIIWSKPNPMPESVTDRPTESHEYILLLTKATKYYWDQEAVREPYSPTERWSGDTYKGAVKKGTHGEDAGLDRERSCFPNTGRNLRSVWEFPTQPYPEAHFAIFPEKLPELCIKVTTPEVGCCSKCGAPAERIKEPDVGGTKGHSWHPHIDDLGQGNVKHQTGKEYQTYKRGETIGWQSTCKCDAPRVPSIVLDPFMGAGTTLWVAKKLNRKAVGYQVLM